MIVQEFLGKGLSLENLGACRGCLPAESPRESSLLGVGLVIFMYPSTHCLGSAWRQKDLPGGEGWDRRHAVDLSRCLDMRLL